MSDWIPSKNQRFWAIEKDGLFQGHRARGGPFLCKIVVKKHSKVIYIATPGDERTFHLDTWEFEEVQK